MDVGATGGQTGAQTIRSSGRPAAAGPLQACSSSGTVRAGPYLTAQGHAVQLSQSPLWRPMQRGPVLWGQKFNSPSWTKVSLQREWESKEYEELKDG